MNTEDMQPPLIRWSQDSECVFCTVRPNTTSTACKNTCGLQGFGCLFAASAPDISSNRLADTICFSQDTVTFSLQLYDSFVESESVVKPLKCGGGFQLKLSKKKGSKTWPRLTHDAEKHHFISIDWGRWYDDDNHIQEDEDSVCTVVPADVENCVTLPDGTFIQIAPLKFCGGCCDFFMKIDSDDCVTIPGDIIPSLKDLLSRDRSHNVTQFWKNTLTTAQRLYTLTALWNATSLTERQGLLKKMSQIMKDFNGTLADAIKGGSNVLRDLELQEYAKRHITLPQVWVTNFSDTCDSEEKVLILTELFAMVSDNEKVIVTSTFI